MARKSRQRISYVIPLANDKGGHRLGVNGLAVDSDNSILYTGGRDGVIYAWKVRGQSQSPEISSRQRQDSSRNRRQLHTNWKHAQAHTHWINDLILVQSDSAVVSASSDISVKIWRPHAGDAGSPNTIGLHSDYVKCLGSPGKHSPWVASGGLDHKIILWDLNGAGARMEIDTADEGATTKGSVYTIGAKENLLASGGPENVVKVWDSRTGKRVTKFVGHTDNVRSILVSASNDLIMSASSDQTIKIWSMTAGRCLNTLTMHSDSVWCLYSEHPQLSVFYSGDRSGYLAKTDTRNAMEVEDGLCVAMCKENEGINKIACANEHIWTATSSSSINQWADMETSAGVQLPDNMKSYRWSNHSRARMSISSQTSSPIPQVTSGTNRIPLSCVLRIAHTSNFPPFQPKDVDRTGSNALPHARKPSNIVSGPELPSFAPLRNSPEDTIDGQHGLIKHVVLNDRRHVLTLDTTGEVTLWDILECTSKKTFGKRHLDDVAKEINTNETLPHWCAVDTRTGTLTCVLEEGHCFDAEMYADELENVTGIEFKEDQRINLGKWVLNYLFQNLIEEELRRDERFRRELAVKKDQSSTSWRNTTDPGGLATPRASHVHSRSLMTPTSAIGTASPIVAPTSPLITGQLQDKVDSNEAGLGPVGERSEKSIDYFSDLGHNERGLQDDTTAGVGATAAEETKEEGPPQSPNDAEKNAAAKDTSTSFSKRLRMSFGSKKLGRSQAAEANRPAAVDEKDESLESKETDEEGKSYDECFFGVLQKVRNEYKKGSPEGDGLVKSLLSPATQSEAPLLKPHPMTKLIVQEERQNSGGVADLFEGNVGKLDGDQIDLLEKMAPFWLGELLLLNRIPPKEIIKVSFTLEPFQRQLPFVTDGDGTERLNANRMLRARKVLAYVADRLNMEPVLSDEPQKNSAKKPEGWLQLYCQNQLLSPRMTLAAIRQHVWRGGGDVVLVYKLSPDVRVQAIPQQDSPGATEKPVAGGETS